MPTPAGPGLPRAAPSTWLTAARSPAPERGLAGLGIGFEVAGAGAGLAWDQPGAAHDLVDELGRQHNVAAAAGAALDHGHERDAGPPVEDPFVLGEDLRFDFRRDL